MKKIILLLLVLLFLVSIADGSCTQISGETPNFMYTPADARVTFFLGHVDSVELCYQHSIPQGGARLSNGQYNEIYLIFRGDNITLISTPKDPNIIDDFLGMIGL
jgi:hypothetical protein